MVPKQATERTEEPWPVHNKANIKLVQAFIYVLYRLHVKKSKANLNPIIRNKHWQSPWQALLIDLSTGDTQLLESSSDCLRAVGDVMISVKCRLSNFNS